MAGAVLGVGVGPKHRGQQGLRQLRILASWCILLPGVAADPKPKLLYILLSFAHRRCDGIVCDVFLR